MGGGKKRWVFEQKVGKEGGERLRRKEEESQATF